MARLYEYQGKDLFRSMGIPVPRGRVAKDPIDAARIAQELGSPVASLIARWPRSIRWRNRPGE